MVEEEHTRQELKEKTSALSTEKLQLQKKVVELDSKLRFVETTLCEWKEKAFDLESEVRTLDRQSKLQVGVVNDPVDWYGILTDDRSNC